MSWGGRGPVIKGPQLQRLGWQQQPSAQLSGLHPWRRAGAMGIEHRLPGSPGSGGDHSFTVAGFRSSWKSRVAPPSGFPLRGVWGTLPASICRTSRARGVGGFPRSGRGEAWHGGPPGRGEGWLAFAPRGWAVGMVSVVHSWSCPHLGRGRALYVGPPLSLRGGPQQSGSKIKEVQKFLHLNFLCS